MEFEFKPSYFKDFNKLPKEIKKKIRNFILKKIIKIETIIGFPNTKKMRGDKNFYRIRIGDYRIGFQYIDNKIIFHRILHRKDIYKYFP